MKLLNIKLSYMPMNWNKYINLERSNKFWANAIKQKEKEIVNSQVTEKYTGNYPIEIIFKPHFRSKRMDLDNTRIKGIIDGLVAAEVIKNDNLNCIQKISFEPVFDNEELLEITIKEINSKEVENYG